MHKIPVDELIDLEKDPQEDGLYNKLEISLRKYGVECTFQSLKDHHYFECGEVVNGIGICEHHFVIQNEIVKNTPEETHETLLKAIRQRNNLYSNIIAAGFEERDVLERLESMLSSQERIENTTEGYVYLVKEMNQGHVKIGRSKDIRDRLQTFNVKLPFKIELLHTIFCEDYVFSEKILHNHFDDLRVDGEWFSLAEKDINEIKNDQFIRSLGINLKPI